MEPDSRASKQASQVHPSAAAVHQMSSKSVNIIYVSTKVDESSKTILLPAATHQPDEAEGGQINSRNKQMMMNKSQVWDCGSSLYDSFELNSFNRQLDSAIKASSSSRTLSMPHLPEQVMTITKHHQKKVGKLSNSFRKILRSVFGSSTTSNSRLIESKTIICEKHWDGDSHGSKSMRVLTTIPEMLEIYGHPAKFSLDTTPVVRRAASERFTATTVCSV